MILPLNKGPIAQWNFQDESIPKLTWFTMEKSLTSLAKTVSVLRDNKLLFPNNIRLSQWMRANDHEVANSERVEKPAVTMAITPLNPFEKLFQLCHSLITNETLYPITIEVFGSGIIFTEHGDFEAENIVWLNATTLHLFSILIATQSDAWLPFSLSGEPQDNIYKMNTDRLADALKDIQQEIGFKLEEGIEGQFSVIRGFRLDNIRYSDGSIADVV